MTTIEKYRQFIEHAPKDPRPGPRGLIGFTDRHDIFVCSTCAGRMFARGCQLDQPAIAVWDSTERACAVCDPNAERGDSVFGTHRVPLAQG